LGGQRLAELVVPVVVPMLVSELAAALLPGEGLSEAIYK